MNKLGIENRIARPNQVKEFRQNLGDIYKPKKEGVVARHKSV